MAKTNESDAPAADTTTTPAPAPAASTPVAARASIPALGVVGIAAGTVLAAGLFFGGGLAVGMALPDAHRGPAFANSQLGNGEQQRDGVRPNDRQGLRPSGQDGQRPPFGEQGPQQPGPQQPGPQQSDDAPDDEVEN
jgi:hypothetical protein